MAVLRFAADLRVARSRARALGLCPSPDKRKAWDNLFALESIRNARVDLHDPIADLGSRSGILLTWLDQLGYRELYGCDLRRPLPPVKSALRAGQISTAVCGTRMYLRNRRRLAVASLERTPFPSGAFAVVTAMSVVEHGVDIRRFFAEVARLLRPGGLCIVSTDYWPLDLETEGLRRFGYIDRDDRIFSTEDVRALVSEADAHGLRLIDELDLDVDAAPIEAHGLNYTFLTIRFKLDGGAEDSEGPPAADERR